MDLPGYYVLCTFVLASEAGADNKIHYSVSNFITINFFKVIGSKRVFIYHFT